jgi:uncharacterized protein YqfA (UPF0365 family)
MLISCSMIIIVTIPFSLWISSIVAFVSIGVMPAVGSSKRTSDGFAARVMPISRYLWSP